MIEPHPYREEIEILAAAVHQLTHMGIALESCAMDPYQKRRFPFRAGYSFAYFVYDPLAKKIISIEYMKNERGETGTIKL